MNFHHVSGSNRFGTKPLLASFGDCLVSVKRIISAGRGRGEWGGVGGGGGAVGGGGAWMDNGWGGGGHGER